MKKEITICLLGLFLLTVPVIITASENKSVLQVAVAKSEPAIRDITPSDKSMDGSNKNVKIIEIVSHSIQSSSPQPPEPVAIQRIAEEDREVIEKSEEVADEEDLNDGEPAADSGDVAVINDHELAEEPCDCGTMAKGECVTCPDEESN